MFILKKLHVLPKLTLLKVGPVPAKHIINYYDCSIHYFKTLKGKSFKYVQAKTGIMLWFDDWNKAKWESSFFLAGRRAIFTPWLTLTSFSSW